MMGVIEGGMSFVWAAYGITWAGLVAYGISLVIRYRSLP
jgi:heme exporter protein D